MSVLKCRAVDCSRKSLYQAAELCLGDAQLLQDLVK